MMQTFPLPMATTFQVIGEVLQSVVESSKGSTVGFNEHHSARVQQTSRAQPFFNSVSYSLFKCQLLPQAFQKPEVRCLYRHLEDTYKVPLSSHGLVSATRSDHAMASQKASGILQPVKKLREVFFNCHPIVLNDQTQVQFQMNYLQLRYLEQQQQIIESFTRDI